MSTQLTDTELRLRAIAIGLCYLTATVTFFIANLITSGLFAESDVLGKVGPMESELILSVFLDLLNGIVVVINAVTFYRILARTHPTYAQGFLSFRLGEFVMIAIYTSLTLFLISLGQLYVDAGSPADGYHHDLASLLIAGRHWLLILIYIINGVLGSYLCFALYQNQLVPRWLSLFGVIGYPVIFAGSVLGLFQVIDVEAGLGMLVLAPGGLFEFILPFWLFFKGFAIKKSNSA
jgi:hypothetical protein